MEISNLVVEGVSVDRRFAGCPTPVIDDDELSFFMACSDKELQFGESVVASFMLRDSRMLFCGEVIEKVTMSHWTGIVALDVCGYKVRGKVTESNQSPSPPHSGRCGGGGGEAPDRISSNAAQLLDNIANDIEAHNGMPYELQASMLEWLPQLRDMVVRLRKADVNDECTESDQCWLG